MSLSVAFTLALLGSPGLLIVALYRWGRRDLPEGDFDALIVAGCPPGADGRAGRALQRRVALAGALFQQGRAPRVVLTGGSVKHPVTEARAAQDYWLSLGLPAEVLVLEERSSDTWGNARESAALLDARAVLVVTDAPHVLRCELLFRRYFPTVRAAGAPLAPGTALRLGLRELVSLARLTLRAPGHLT